MNSNPEHLMISNTQKKAIPGETQHGIQAPPKTSTVETNILHKVNNAPKMNSMLIEDHSTLPPFFYRVQWRGCHTADGREMGLVASEQWCDAAKGESSFAMLDDRYRVNVEHQLLARLYTDQGRPTPFESWDEEGHCWDPGSAQQPLVKEVTSPFISVFADRDDAKRWAEKQSRRTGRNCRIFVIPTRYLRGEVAVCRLDPDLVEALAVDVSDELVFRWVYGALGCEERHSTYLLLHGVPGCKISAEFWWGLYPIPHEWECARQIMKSELDRLGHLAVSLHEIPVVRHPYVHPDLACCDNSTEDVPDSKDSLISWKRSSSF